MFCTEHEYNEPTCPACMAHPRELVLSATPVFSTICDHVLVSIDDQSRERAEIACLRAEVERLCAITRDGRRCDECLEAHDAVAEIKALKTERDSARAKVIEEAATVVEGAEGLGWSEAVLAKSIRALHPTPAPPGVVLLDGAASAVGSNIGIAPAPVERVECDRCGDREHSDLAYEPCRNVRDRQPCPGHYILKGGPNGKA